MTEGAAGETAEAARAVMVAATIVAKSSVPAEGVAIVTTLQERLTRTKHETKNVMGNFFTVTSLKPK